MLVPVLGMIVIAAGCTPALEPTRSGPVSDLPPFQEAILHDGAVTSAEFESAVLATIACLEERGVVIVEFEIRGGGWSLAYESGPEDSTAADQIYEDCYEERLVFVEEGYLAGFDPPPEAIEAGRRAMVECLQEAGVDISDDATSTDIRAVVDSDAATWFACTEVRDDAEREAGG